MNARRWIAGMVSVGLVGFGLSTPTALADDNDIGPVDVAAEAVPDALTHQGRLMDDEGHPITGEVELTYTIWDHPTEGNVLWQDAVNVELDDSGFYSVELGGEDNPIDAVILAEGHGWLGVAVDGGDEMDPRITLNSVPYALVAEQALRAGEAAVAEHAGFADSAESAATAEYAELAAAVEDGSIGSSALADDFQVDIEHVEDATGTTLGGLSCVSGELPMYDGNEWRCEQEADRAAVAEVAESVEDGSIQSDSLASDFSVTPQQVDGDTLGGLACANGDIARFDGSSWNCDDFLDGAVTSVSATGPVESTGGTDPTVSIPRSDAGTDGYLAAADFASFADRVDSVQQGDGISIGGDLNPEVAVEFGDEAGTVTEGDDPRLSDAREPLPGSDHYLQSEPDSPQDSSINLAGDGYFGGQVGVGTEDPDSGVHIDGDYLTVEDSSNRQQIIGKEISRLETDNNHGVVLLVPYGADGESRDQVMGTIYGERSSGRTAFRHIDIYYSSSRQASGGSAGRYRAALEYHANMRGSWNAENYDLVRVMYGGQAWVALEFEHSTGIGSVDYFEGFLDVREDDWAQENTLRVLDVDQVDIQEPLDVSQQSRVFQTGRVGIGEDMVDPAAELEVQGDIVADSKDFLIDHPLDPDNMQLRHSALEGPERAVFYRGEESLVDGEATIGLPDYFEELTREDNRTVQLTARGDEPFALSYGEIDDGEFTVYADAEDGEFSWEVTAERADRQPLEVEMAQ